METILHKQLTGYYGVCSNPRCSRFDEHQPLGEKPSKSQVCEECNSELIVFGPSREQKAA